MLMKRIFSLALGMGMATILLVLALTGVKATETGSLSRLPMPVTINGALLPAHLGAPISELKLYRYHTNGWEPVPFQIDEVTATGIFTGTEDGLLDSNDELTFMSQDAGFVTPVLWVDDAEAQSHERVELLLDDALTMESAALYLYRSNTLPSSSESYISWNPTTQQMTAAAYSIAFEPESFLGFSSMQLLGQTADMLDRQKLRGSILVSPPPPFPPFSTSFNEEDVASQFGVPTTITLPITGPIRALGGSDSQQFAFYGWQVDTALAIDFSDVVTNLTTLHVEEVRISLDWLDPAGAGFGPATYFDSNTPGGVATDGNPDAIPALPVPAWQEIAAAQGSVVSLATIDPGQGTVAGFYRDDLTLSSGDTGDGRSFSEFGFVVTEPNGIVTATNSLYFWPGSSGTQGATVLSQMETPLSVTTNGQSYEPARAIYLPVIARP